MQQICRWWLHKYLSKTMVKEKNRDMIAHDNDITVINRLYMGIHNAENQLHAVEFL
jgi:hypothetical protein